MTQRVLITCLLAFGLHMAGLGRASAELKMGAQMASERITVGENTYMVMYFTGADQNKQPSFELLEGDAKGLRVVLEAPSEEQVTIEGKLSRLVTYRFHITGVKKGNYEFVAVLEHEGEEYQTDQMKLTVRPQTAAERSITPIIELSTDKKEIYIGELLPLKILFTTDNTTRPEFHNESPEVESNGFMMHPLKGIFSAPAEGTRKKFALHGRCLRATQNR